MTELLAICGEAWCLDPSQLFSLSEATASDYHGNGPAQTGTGDLQRPKPVSAEEATRQKTKMLTVNSWLYMLIWAAAVTLVFLTFQWPVPVGIFCVVIVRSLIPATTSRVNSPKEIKAEVLKLWLGEGWELHARQVGSISTSSFCLYKYLVPS